MQTYNKETSMRYHYEIAGCRFAVEGETLPSSVASMQGFSVFAAEAGDVLFRMNEAEPEEAPAPEKMLFSIFHEGCRMDFSTCSGGHVLVLTKADSCLKLWRCGKGLVHIAGSHDPQLLRFALWIGFGLEVIALRRIPIHCSCIVKDGRAYLFLGESGTGKSTHTGLWLKHVEGAVLLNDDSPIISAESGEIWVYGSPWSGKTPCYKQERYPLGGCVRLSQAPYNKIERLSNLRAFTSLHPSCPPQFAPDRKLYDEIFLTLGEILEKTEIWHLECLPNAEAVRLAYDTITKKI